MIEVERDLWRSSCPASLLEVGSLTTKFSEILSIFRNGVKLLSGQPVLNEKNCSPVHSKKAFLVCKWNFFCFILGHTSLVLSQGAVENSMALSSLKPAVRCLCTSIRYLLSLLISMLKKKIPALLALPHDRCFNPLTILWALTLVCPCISCTGQPRHSTPDVILSAASREGSPLLTCW